MVLIVYSIQVYTSVQISFTSSRHVNLVLSSIIFLKSFLLFKCEAYLYREEALEKLRDKLCSMHNICRRSHLINLQQLYKLGSRHCYKV